MSILPSFANMVDYSSMKHSIVPRMTALCIETRTTSVSHSGVYSLFIHLCHEFVCLSFYVFCLSFYVFCLSSIACVYLLCLLFTFYYLCLPSIACVYLLLLVFTFYCLCLSFYFLPIIHLGYKIFVSVSLATYV